MLLVAYLTRPSATLEERSITDVFSCPHSKRQELLFPARHPVPVAPQLRAPVGPTRYGAGRRGCNQVETDTARRGRYGDRQNTGLSNPCDPLGQTGGDLDRNKKPSRADLP